MRIKPNSSRAKRSITERVWEELKKINWREVNRLTSYPFTVGLVGNEPNIAKMKAWLSSFPYKLSYDSIRKEVKQTRTINRSAKDKIVLFDPTKSIDERLAKSLSFCIVQKEFINNIRRIHVQSYVFDPSQQDDLVSNILANNEDIRFALAYSFPVFRPETSRGEVNATAIQNASWAIATAAPNVIPGPHQTVTVPVEAISDFAVLTTNEVKMMFEIFVGVGPS